MPMSHEARQFHHIMDMVDNLDEDFLRGKVQHLPLYIAAKNYERERDSRTTLHNDSIEICRKMPYCWSTTMMNKLTDHHVDDAERLQAVSNQARQLNYNPTIQAHDKSLSTNEYFVGSKNIDPSSLSTTIYRIASPLDVASPNKEPHEFESFADNSHIILNSTPYLADELDNGDDFCNNPTSTSSGSGPVKRRWGVRKSPNSRITHNMNEKNRRADLRESLERLKFVLPLFQQKNCKSTTSDILQHAHGFVTEAIRYQQLLLQRRVNLFETCRIYKINICRRILNSNCMMFCSDLTDEDPSAAMTAIMPMNEVTRSIFQRYLETNDYITPDSLFNMDLNQLLYPTLDYNAIDMARRKYLQSSSINIPTILVKKYFNMLEKTKLIPSNSVSSNKETLATNTNNPSIPIIADEATHTFNEVNVPESQTTSSAFELLNESNNYNPEEEQYASTVYARVSSPLMIYSMVNIPSSNISPPYKTEKISTHEETSNSNQNESKSSIIPNTTASTCSNSTSSIIGTMSIPNIADVSITTSDLMNTSRSSYSSNHHHHRALLSENISDEDTTLNNELYVECYYPPDQSMLIAENDFQTNVEQSNNNSPRASNDKISSSSMVNSRSKSNG